MPDAPRPTPAPRRATTRQRVILSVIAFVAAVVVLALVTFGPARDREVSNLGDDVFEFNATRIAVEIADRGPIGYPDPLGGDRPLWVQHLGSTPDEGWYVFSQLSPAGCLAEWQADTETFVDCEGTAFPADGTGLPQFPVEVDGSVVEVDLNFADRAATEESDR